ncbi:hypothetical protein, partial [Vibrio nigripulchritudo]|uniref:hypothetical protein n=1 Tax=Vibrio nigripulchritudo TaxID=28173 RepID=UPI0005713F33
MLRIFEDVGSDCRKRVVNVTKMVGKSIAAPIVLCDNTPSQFLLSIRLMHSGADMSSRKHLANAIRALSMDGVQAAN